PARPTGRSPEHRDTDSSTSATDIRSVRAADDSHQPHTPTPHGAMTQPTTGGRADSEQSTTPSRPNPFRAISFMIVCFTLRIVQFVLLVTGFVVGVATLIIWVGIPILLSVTLLARYFGDLDRRLVVTMLVTPIPAVERRPLTGGTISRWRSRLTDPTTWRDTGYILLTLPLGIVEFTLALPSIILVPLALWVIPWAGWLHAQLAHTLLGPPKAQRAEARAQRIQASRARGVDAAEAERRRIERDLHDGTQQRLASPAMGIGRAKSKLDSEPGVAADLLDDAHADAKQAVSELRDLARGIYPAVLADRGLDAALSGLAANSAIPIDITVDVEPRPPAAVESTAYFIVGETLANITKHSGADHAIVTVRRTTEQVT